MGIAWLVIVAAEMLVGGTGIGYFVWNEWNNLSITNMIFAILVIGAGRHAARPRVREADEARHVSGVTAGGIEYHPHGMRLRERKRASAEGRR